MSTTLAHFVDAGRLARKLGTVNIHALYSSSEMDSARASMIAEATYIHSTSFAARLAEATAREARSVPLRFHDQLISLWEYDSSTKRRRRQKGICFCCIPY